MPEPGSQRRLRARNPFLDSAALPGRKHRTVAAFVCPISIRWTPAGMVAALKSRSRERETPENKIILASRAMLKQPRYLGPANALFATNRLIVAAEDPPVEGAILFQSGFCSRG